MISLLIQQNLFSDLYLAKFSDNSTNSFRVRKRFVCFLTNANIPNWSEKESWKQKAASYTTPYRQSYVCAVTLTAGCAMFVRYSDLDKRGWWPIGSGEIAENRSMQFWQRANSRGCINKVAWGKTEIHQSKQHFMKLQFIEP